MERYKIVLLRHDKYSIGVEGLVSIACLDSKPWKIELDGNKAAILAVVAADAPSDVLHLHAANDVPAIVIRDAFGQAKAVMKAAEASAGKYISTDSDSENRLILRDNNIPLELLLNCYVPADALILRSEIDTEATLIIKNISDECRLHIMPRVGEMHLLTDISATNASMVVSGRGTLGFGADVDACPCEVMLDVAVSEACLFAPHYVSEWMDFRMSELANMTIFDMMYEEVPE